MTALNLDSNALMTIYSAIANPMTGLGTARDKSKHARLETALPYVSQHELSAIARKSGAIGRLNGLLPQECCSDWLKLNFGSADFAPDEVHQYLRGLSQKEGKLDAVAAFELAATLGRQDGDGFVLMGIADGNPPDRPVDLDRVESVRWLAVRSRWEVYPEDYVGNPYTPNYFRVYRTFKKDIPDEALRFSRWHCDRVLRFSGTPLVGSALVANAGYNDPVIYRVLEAWQDWVQGLMAGSAMLADYDQGLWKMKGLAQALARDIREGNSTYQNQIFNRLMSLEMGRSVLKAVLLDKDDEDFVYASRTYSGADKIQENLKDRLGSECDIPRFKLFNEGAGGTGLGSTNTAGLAQRYEWTECKKAWANKSLVPQFEKLVRYVLHAADGPTKGGVPDLWSVESASEVILTAEEQADLELKLTERNERLVMIQAISPQEVRHQYAGTKFTGEIVLEEERPTPTTRNDYSYVKRIIKWGDREIGLEYAPGDKRFGRKLKVGYGHIRRHVGEDGEALDCYVSPEFIESRSFAGKVYRVAQLSAEDGDFDEYKFMIGFGGINAARQAYLGAMPVKFLGGIEPVSVESLDDYRRDAKEHGHNPDPEQLRHDFIAGAIDHRTYLKLVGYSDPDRIVQRCNAEFNADTGLG